MKTKIILLQDWNLDSKHYVRGEEIEIDSQLAQQLIDSKIAKLKLTDARTKL
jgi:hypothetical protein